MNLAEFDRRLREIAPNNTRPFLCEGSPFECRAFIVGLNPRTQTPFWPHWNVSTGCCKSSWLDEYRRRHNNKLGRTRECIEILFEALGPFKCLETNLYPGWSNRFRDLPIEFRNTNVFDFILDAVKPNLVFVHGRKAILHIERITGQTAFRRDEVLRNIQLPSHEADLYLRHHLSYQLSTSECRRIGERLREHLIHQ